MAGHRVAPRLASGRANAMANADAQPAGLQGPRGPRLPGVIERAPRVVAGLTEERNQLAPQQRAAAGR